MRFDRVSRVRLTAVAVVSALAVAACGGSDSVVSSDDAVQTESAAEQSADASVDAVVEDGADAVGTVEADDAPADPSVAVATDNEIGPIEVEGSSLAPFDSSISDDMVGTSSPVITGQTFDGSAIQIGAPTDKPTFVVFLAHWCPHCNEEAPELVKLDDEGLIPDGVDVVGVSTAVDAEAPNFPPSKWIEGLDWPWPVMMDSGDLGAMAAVGGNSFPFAVVLDTDGTVLARRAGQATGDETVAFLDDALSRASA